MKDCYGQHGWREFHTNRKRILNEFDILRELTANRPVQTAHGIGAEAFIRKWFSDFLPKKFGVTSGYIIPDLYQQDLKLYHYDIIIYDALEAPSLWAEGNADDSDQGRFRAIPAKHVVAVYEVKARLTKPNVKDALRKLNETASFSAQLHRHYSCGAVFIDLMESDNGGDAIIEELFTGKSVFGFRGGVVLRYEGDDTATGLIGFLAAEVRNRGGEKSGHGAMKGLRLAKPIDDVDVYLREDGSLELGELGAGAELFCATAGRWEVSKSYGRMYSEDGLSVQLNWSRGNFSQFCIRLLSALEGLPFNDKNQPSFGRVFDKVETRKSPPQGAQPMPGLPFIEATLHPGGPKGETMLIDVGEESATAKFWIRLENRGDTAAQVSDDGFKTSIALPPGEKATKPVAITLATKGDGSRIEDVLKKDPPELRYRLVYFPTPGDKNLLAIEKTIRIDKSDPRMF